MDYKKRCADCACLVEKNGVWLCDECFGQKCEDIDECPEGVKVEDVEKMDSLSKTKIDHGIKGDVKEKKPTKPKTVKVSDEKAQLFSLLWEGLYNFYGENAQISKQNKEISVQIGEKSFKIDLVEHRNKK